MNNPNPVFSMKIFSSFPATALQIISNTYGRVGVPILLYFLGVPGFVVIFLWLFFFRGR